MAQQKTLTTSELCRQLTTYEQAPGVGYTAGVDVHGREVAPADLDGGSTINMPDTIDLAITVDQAQKLGLPNNLPYKPEAYIGNVTVTKQGTVYFNNKRISEPQLQALCPARDVRPKPATLN